MACCGRSCSITFDSKPTEGFIGEINVEGDPVDVTVFGDGAAGSTIVCKESASVAVTTYDDPGVSVGETVKFSCNVCSNAYSATVCDVISKNCRFESTGVPYWVTTIRAEDTITDF